jgi:hypothetical protein
MAGSIRICDLGLERGDGWDDQLVVSSRESASSSRFPDSPLEIFLAMKYSTRHRVVQTDT